jgi:hypothetical protein
MSIVRDFETELKELKKAYVAQEAEIARLKELSLAVILGIDAVQMDTCMQEDWDKLNQCANKLLDVVQ